MSKYGDLIKKAREPENQQSGLPENHQGRTEEDPEVNLCVKVPLSLRRHWASASKRTGISMTSIIIEALKAKFGEPE